MATINSINNQILNNDFTVDNGTITASGSIDSTGSSISANTSLTAGTTVTAGTGLSVTTGDADILAGDINVNSGSITASGSIDSSGSSMSASTTITAGTGLTVTTGNADILSGNLNVGTASPSLAFEVSVEKSVAGNMGAFIANTSSSTSADTLIQLQTETGAGDPSINFITNGGQTFSYGIDNSDADALKITDGSSPSAGTTNWKMTSDGERTMPLQPAFLARHTVAQNNITGTGTSANINYTTVIFDQNSDYDGTNAFIAPVTGKYMMSASIGLSGLSGGTNGLLLISTSNRAYQGIGLDYSAIDTSSGVVLVNMSVIADMDALDVARVTVKVFNMGGDTVDAPAITEVYFCGALLV